MNRFLKLALCAVLSVVTVVPALADGRCNVPDIGLTQRDSERVEFLTTSRTKGLAAALGAVDAEERSIVSDLFANGTAPVDPDLLAGDYRCRTIKMGGISPLVVYTWFQCRITPEERAFNIVKLTGSQNFSGTLFPAKSGGYAYRGAFYYGYEDPLFYGDDPERNESGCLSATATGERHFILELPEPAFESYHDLIELVPAD